jgi:hypothetical protein
MSGISVHALALLLRAAHSETGHMRGDGQTPPHVHPAVGTLPLKHPVGSPPPSSRAGWKHEDLRDERPREGAATLGMVLEPGTIVAGRFEVAELVDSGGMGSVYRAVDLLDARPRHRAQGDPRSRHGSQRAGAQPARATHLARHPAAARQLPARGRAARQPAAPLDRQVRAPRAYPVGGALPGHGVGRGRGLEGQAPPRAAHGGPDPAAGAALGPRASRPRIAWG